MLLVGGKHSTIVGLPYIENARVCNATEAFFYVFSSIRFWLLLNSISVMKRLLCSRRTDERDTRESMDLEEM